MPISLTNIGYCAIVNYLDFTAVSFPVTTVNESIDTELFQEGVAKGEDAKVQADCKSVVDPHVSSTAMF